MRASTLRVPIVLCLLTVSSLAHADEKAVKSILIANYAKFAAAFQKNDIEAMSNMLTQDYTTIQSDGNKIDRATVIAIFRQQRKSLLSTTMNSKIDKLTVQGSKAIVIVHIRTAGVISDAQGQHHTLVANAVSRDTWVKTGSSWKLKSNEARKATAIMDGKPMPTGGNGN